MRLFVMLVLSAIAAAPMAKAGQMVATSPATASSSLVVDGRTIPVYEVLGLSGNSVAGYTIGGVVNQRYQAGQTKFMTITVTLDGDGLQTLTSAFGKAHTDNVEIVTGSLDFTMNDAIMVKTTMTRGRYDVELQSVNVVIDAPPEPATTSAASPAPDTSQPVTGHANSLGTSQAVAVMDACRDDLALAAAAGTHINNCSDETTTGYDLPINDAATVTVVGPYTLRAYDTGTGSQTLEGIYTDLRQKLSAAGFRLLLTTDPIHITATKGDIWIIEDIYDTTPVGYEQKVFHAISTTVSH